MATFGLDFFFTKPCSASFHVTRGDDFNLSNASVGTGVQDADVKALTNYAELIDCGNHAAGDAPIELTALHPANHYLYLSCGAATDADFSAGRLLITLWGYAA